MRTGHAAARVQSRDSDAYRRAIFARCDYRQKTFALFNRTQRALFQPIEARYDKYDEDAIDIYMLL